MKNRSLLGTVPFNNIKIHMFMSFNDFNVVISFSTPILIFSSWLVDEIFI